MRLKGNEKGKKIIWLIIAMLMVLLCFKGCRKKIHMDEEKCAEVALEYMKNKYGKEFVLISSSEIIRINGPAGIAEVEVQNVEDKNIYIITIYPNGKSDKDKDGYYDSYKVISDDYMCVLVEDYAKNGMAELLSDAGLTEFVCSVSMRSIGFEGEWGIASEFPIPDEDTFSMKNVLNNYTISTYCWLFIPESENNDMLQENIERTIKPLVLKGYIKFDINIYSNEDYAIIKETNNGSIENKVTEKEYFSFIIKNK